MSTSPTVSSARDEVRQVVPRLITVAALVALYRPDQLKVHPERALANGVTREEISEVITHLAFYAGWPSAMSGARVAKQVLDGRPA